MACGWQIVAELSSGASSFSNCGSIFVQCDGYPQSAFKLLTKHYNTQQKVVQLISLGDCVSIDQDIDQCDRFVDHGDNWNDVEPSYGANIASVTKKHSGRGEQYRYTWDGTSWSIGVI